jgi:hypothetical protein
LIAWNAVKQFSLEALVEDLQYYNYRP